MNGVEDGFHRRLMGYAGQELPPGYRRDDPWWPQGQEYPLYASSDPQRDPFLHDLTLPEVHGRMSVLHSNRTRPALPSQGVGGYLGQFTSTVSLTDRTMPWDNRNTTERRR